MSITAAELICYGSAVMAEDDTTGSQGGAIDLTTQIEFTDITPAAKLEVVSANAGDSMNLTITGRDATGVIVTETHALNGVTVVQFSTNTLERILKVVLASAAAGAITIRTTGGGSTWITIAVGVTTVRRPFYNASTPPSSTKSYYEKVFFKNTNGTLALTSALLHKQADTSGKITFALENALGDTNTTTNRVTTPTSSGISAFDANDKNVSNSGNLTAGAAQGVWLCLTLASTDVATKTTFTMRLQGNTI